MNTSYWQLPPWSLLCPVLICVSCCRLAPVLVLWCMLLTGTNCNWHTCVGKQAPSSRKHLTHLTHCEWCTCGGTQGPNSEGLSYAYDTPFLAHLLRYPGSSFWEAILRIWHTVFCALFEVHRLQLPGDHLTHLTYGDWHTCEVYKFQLLGDHPTDMEEDNFFTRARNDPQLF